IEADQVESWNVARSTDDEVNGLTAIERVVVARQARAEPEVHAFGVARERAVRPGHGGGNPQRSGVVAAAGGELISIRRVVGAALPAFAAARIHDRAALDQVRSRLSDKVGVGSATPKRLFKVPVLDVMAEALPKT